MLSSYSTPQDRNVDFFPVDSVLGLKMEEVMPRSDEGLIHLYNRQHTTPPCSDLFPEGCPGARERYLELK